MEDRPAYGERIARLEAQMEALKDDVVAVNNAIVDIKKSQREMLGLLNDIATQQARWKGTVGGVTLVIGGIVTLLSLAKDWLISALK